MSACNCLEILRSRLEAQHGEGSNVELELVSVMLTDPKAEEWEMSAALPPLYYTYRVGKKRRKTHVVFNFCPFCGRPQQEKKK